MSQSPENRRVPRDVLERMRMAAAVAAGAVLDEHVRSATELVRHGSDRVPVERLLAIYGRLHRLDETDHRAVAERTLAYLGRDPDSAVGAGGLAEPRSLFRRLRNRLRGRVHLDLREWVDFHAAHVAMRVLEIHAEHAHNFIRLAAEHARPVQAVAHYVEMLALPEPVATMVRLRVLASLYKAAPPAEITPIRPEAPRAPLRLANEGS